MIDKEISRCKKGVDKHKHIHILTYLMCLIQFDLVDYSPLPTKIHQFIKILNFIGNLLSPPQFAFNSRSGCFDLMMIGFARPPVILAFDYLYFDSQHGWSKYNYPYYFAFFNITKIKNY